MKISSSRLLLHQALAKFRRIFPIGNESRIRKSLRIDCRLRETTRKRRPLPPRRARAFRSALDSIEMQRSIDRSPRNLPLLEQVALNREQRATCGAFADVCLGEKTQAAQVRVKCVTFRRIDSEGRTSTACILLAINPITIYAGKYSGKHSEH
jgi:hypothetical protein